MNRFVLKSAGFLILFFIMCQASFAQDKYIDRIAEMLSKEVLLAFPTFKGQVLSTKGEDGVFINIGESSGLKPGEKFKILSQGARILTGEDADKFSGYKTELLALVEVEWVKEDYAYANVVEKYSDIPIDQMDLLEYIQPQITLFVHPFSGLNGENIASSLSTKLAENEFIIISNSTALAQYTLNGEVQEKSYGLDIKITLTYPDFSIRKIDKRVILNKAETQKVITGEGFKAYSLEDKSLDFTTTDGLDILILGERYISRGELNGNALKFTSKDKLSDEGAILSREPIGRICLFDLDGDEQKELLMGRVPSESSRYFTKDEGKFTLAGPFPGVPLSATDSGKLLISSITDGFNLFEPTNTNIITVSSTGSGGQVSVANLNRPFMDAVLYDVNRDGIFELAILFPDGSLSVIDPINPGAFPLASFKGAGLGLFADDSGGLLTSSSGSGKDRILCLKSSGNSLVKVSESVPVPYHIYRIKIINGNIFALGFDDEGTDFLVEFDDFIK